MPHAIQRESSGFYVCYSGQVSGAEFLQSVEEVNVFPHFEASHFVLNDFTACQALDLSCQYLEDAAAAAIGAHVTNPNLIAAFVAVDKTILETIQSIADMVHGCVNVGVFHSLEQARQWVAAGG